MEIIVLSSFLLCVFFWFIYIYLKESDLERKKEEQKFYGELDGDSNPMSLFSAREGTLQIFFKWLSFICLIGFFFELKIYISLNSSYASFDVINNVFLILSCFVFLTVILIDGILIFKHALEDANNTR